MKTETRQYKDVAVVGNKEAEAHFQKRMTESNARMHTEGNRA